MTAVICWVVFMIVMVVIEVIRVDMRFIFYGTGSLLAAVAALFGLPIWAQCIVFGVSSLAFILFVRPMLKSKLDEKEALLRKEEEKRAAAFDKETQE